VQSNQEIIQTVLKYLSKNFELSEKFNNETDLFESRVVDSIGVIELVNFLESEFKISIPFETISVTELKNLNSISAFVIKKKTK
jgi:acyl carrier protein